MELNIKKELKEIKNIKGLVAVYLFGSVAKGKGGPLSDIDICFIGKFSDKDKNKIHSKFLEEKYDISFFDELPIWIKIRVFKEGKQLLINNKKLLFKIIMSTVHEYEDFRPLIQRSIFRRFGEYARY